MSTMARVSRARPCQICKKPDWCMYGKDIAICMRVSSPRSKEFSDGSVGFIHNLSGSEIRSWSENVVKKPAEKNYVDSGRTIREWREKYGLDSLAYLAGKLGVCKSTLQMLGCVKAPQHLVWGFPMHNGKGEIIGIRMRHENGRKWCEPGGHNGLFLPLCTPQKSVVICEGPTDTAAALHIGLYAIGRFNCSGGIMMIQEFIKTYQIRKATIVADVDNDRVINGSVVNPGIQGAMALGELLPIPSRCVNLPAKDIREFVTSGGDLATFNAIADQNVWHKPNR